MRWAEATGQIERVVRRHGATDVRARGPVVRTIDANGDGTWSDGGKGV
jgi:hypothetical protein